MSVTKVELANEGGAIPAGKGGTYDLTYNVWTDDPDDGTVTVAEASPFILGETYVLRHEEDPFATLQEITPERKPKSDRLWTLRLRFAPPPEPSPGDPEKPVDPLVRLPEISWGQEVDEKAVQEAYKLVNGAWTDSPVGVLNSAGTMFATPLVDRVPIPVLHFVRNERVFPTGWELAYCDALNRTSFLSWGVGKVLCWSITGTWAAERVEARWVSYWRVAYEFRFHPRGWWDKLLDVGPYYLEAGSGHTVKKMSVRTVDGVPLHGPFLLDGSGGLLPDAQAQAGNAVYLTYSHRRFLDFSPMRITIPY